MRCWFASRRRAFVTQMRITVPEPAEDVRRARDVAGFPRQITQIRGITPARRGEEVEGRVRTSEGATGNGRRSHDVCLLVKGDATRAASKETNAR